MLLKFLGDSARTAAHGPPIVPPSPAKVGHTPRRGGTDSPPAPQAPVTWWIRKSIRVLVSTDSLESVRPCFFDRDGHPRASYWRHKGVGLAVFAVQL